MEKNSFKNVPVWCRFVLVVPKLAKIYVLLSTYKLFVWQPETPATWVKIQMAINVNKGPSVK